VALSYAQIESNQKLPTAYLIVFPAYLTVFDLKSPLNVEIMNKA
jgi:hypothetical protein